MDNFKALISLLDDTDREVVDAVTGEFVKQGLQIIPQLEKVWEKSDNTMLQERLENVIHNIQFNITIDNLKSWRKCGGESLIEGATYIAQSQFPGVSFDYINGFFDRMRSEFTTDLKTRATAIDKIKVINYVIYHIYQFSRNNQNLFSPQNLYLNQVIETRKGSPLSLALIYLVLAEKIDLPIYGVNFKNSFLLAYKNEFRHIDATEEANDILFYINPFNKGSIITLKEIDYYLVRNNIDDSASSFKTCDNITFIAMLLSNLLIAYQKLGYVEKIEVVKKLIKTLQ